MDDHHDAHCSECLFVEERDAGALIKEGARFKFRIGTEVAIDVSAPLQFLSRNGTPVPGGLGLFQDKSTSGFGSTRPLSGQSPSSVHAADSESARPSPAHICATPCGTEQGDTPLCNLPHWIRDRRAAITHTGTEPPWNRYGREGSSEPVAGWPRRLNRGA